MTNEETVRQMMKDLSEGMKTAGKHFSYNRDTRRLESVDAGTPDKGRDNLRLKPEDMNLG